MTSNIDATKPTSPVSYTVDMRNNFAAAKAEIEALQNISASVPNIKSYGAIMDGASHPLSSQYSSLALAQVVYPHATALTDEIDWCAIQGAVNSLHVAIRIPEGTAIINKPIVSSTVNVTVIGGGTDVSIIIQTAAGQDGWQHNSNMHFQMFGISFRCTGIGGTALRLTFSGNSANITMRDVTLIGNGNQLTNFWHDGIISTGPGLIVMDNVNVTGINTGDLSTIGNAIYITPRTVPSALYCVQIIITNSSMYYYQNAIVLDSAGASLANNIQGVMIDWVNAIGCMQFVRVQSSILELVIQKCSTATYGSAVYAENSFAVIVRDSYFIGYAVNPSRAIAAQLPQDLFYMNDGGTWWIKDNRFQINSGSTWNYVFNFQNTFVGATIRDNAITSQGVTAMSGYINIANGNNIIEESGTNFAFWNVSWPKIVNGNPSGGGAGNKLSLGALVTASTLNGELWQQAGSHIGYNYTTGRGAMDFVNSRGALAGGFYFYTTTSDLAATPTLLAQISNNAIFTCNGLIAKQVSTTGTSYTLAATDSSVIINATATFTITLGSATLSNTGRIVWLKSTAAFLINSATANVVGLLGGAAAFQIMPATAGKWVVLQSDGTNWQIMQGN